MKLTPPACAARRSSDAGWQARNNRPASGGGGGGGGKYSAFLGEYVPLAEAASATPPEAPGQAPRCARYLLNCKRGCLGWERGCSRLVCSNSAAPSVWL